MRSVAKSSRLADVCYDIRGPVLEKARLLEEEGHRILKLNIGNPGVFGFEAPDELVVEMIANLPRASAYADPKGIRPAREAVLEDARRKGIDGARLEDVYIGNGVSELIVMAMQGLLEDGDEVLIPSPDYPLWTAAVRLAGGTPRHYRCVESEGWQPDLAHLRSLVSPRTKALVVISPNNPTGALYPEPVLASLREVAEGAGLVIFSDESYDRIVYDGLSHRAIGSLPGDIVCVTMGGLSKNHRACGFRTGWMVVSGGRSRASNYLEGLDMLAAMRMCPNVPAQYAVPGALGGPQTIDALVAPGGRLRRQRDLAWELLTGMPGVTCHRAQGGLYLFPRLDPGVYPIEDDRAFVLELLGREKVLLVQGSGFNWSGNDHVRIVFLPPEDDLREAVGRFGRFLEHYRTRHLS